MVAADGNEESEDEYKDIYINKSAVLIKTNKRFTRYIVEHLMKNPDTKAPFQDKLYVKTHTTKDERRGNEHLMKNPGRKAPFQNKQYVKTHTNKGERRGNEEKLYTKTYARKDEHPQNEVLEEELSVLYQHGICRLICDWHTLFRQRDFISNSTGLSDSL